MAKSKHARPTNVQIKINKVKLFHKHIVEGKTLAVCADEIGVCSKTLHNYKNSDDYREMALTHLDTSKLGGLKGGCGKLVDALDATRAVVTEDAEGSTHITRVPDNKTRMDALKEVFKIYGVYAAEKRDTTVTVAFSSDADLFRQIDEAQAACCGVKQVVCEQEGSPVASGQPASHSGGLKSRQRTLLHVDTVSESE